MTKHFRTNSKGAKAKSDIWASLKIVALTPETEIKKIMKKRASLRDQISEQILMATNRSYSPMKYKWITESDGHVRRVAIPLKMKKWWRQLPTGQLQICIYTGGKPVELDAGKSAIEIKAHSDLVPTLQLIQEAVDLGDFDDLI